VLLIAQQLLAVELAHHAPLYEVRAARTPR
jgi:hypothetical protein